MIAENATATEEIETYFDTYPGQIAYSAQAERYGVRDGDYLYVMLPALFNDLFAFRSTDRTLPFSFDTFVDENYHIEIELPAGYEPLYIPAPYTWRAPKESGQIEIHIRYEPKIHTLHIEGSAQLAPQLYDAHHFQEFLRTQQLLTHPDRYTLLLKKSDLRAD